MKFRLVEVRSLEEASNAIRRYYGDSSRDKANPKGSNINSIVLLKEFYHKIGYDGSLEMHHIVGNHKGEECIAPSGFNSSFHNVVWNLIETRFKGNTSYKNDLDTLSNVDDAISKLHRVKPNVSDTTMDDWISILNGIKNNIPQNTKDVLNSTDPYVEIIFRKLLNKFIDGKLSHPKLKKYEGRVFYRRTLEKRLGIKF